MKIVYKAGAKDLLLPFVLLLLTPLQEVEIVGEFSMQIIM